MVDHDSTTQLIRWFLMAGSAVLIGASLIVFWTYFHIWLDRKRAHKPGTIPERVILAVLSYDLLLIASVANQLQNYTEQMPFTWRVYLVVPAVLIGLAAMFVILFTDRGRGNDDHVDHHKES